MKTDSYMEFVDGSFGEGLLDIFLDSNPDTKIAAMIPTIKITIDALVKILAIP